MRDATADELALHCLLVLCQSAECEFFFFMLVPHTPFHGRLFHALE